MKLILWYLSIVMLSFCEAYKILAVFPFPAKSHSLLGDGYVRHLLNDGHEVTYVTPFPFKSTSPKLRQIDVSLEGPAELMNITAIMNEETEMRYPSLIYPKLIDLAKILIEHKNVQKLLNDPKEHFDVVITEWMFSELPASYATIFNCPLIWSAPIELNWAILRLIDQPFNPAYSGDALSDYSPPFTFIQRVYELYTQIVVMFIRTVYPNLDAVQTQYYENMIAPIITKRGRKPPPFRDIQFNASMILANTHASMGLVTAIPQNAKTIGGYHIGDVEPLPEALKEIMDNAKNGVLYFSMGSNLRSRDLSEELKKNILDVFRELKQTVIWKFEENLPNKPNNVHILQWAPQHSILSHPNIVGFITHGGILSMIETVHFGVPIIGIPTFADQFVNVDIAVKKGHCLKVDLSYTMAGDLKLAINELLNNPKYAKKAKELSLIYHDRPVPPGQELVHWVKHVIKTRGALHLRSPALHVPFYQKFYLDLLAVILVIIFISLRILKFVRRAFCKNKINNSKKNN